MDRLTQINGAGKHFIEDYYGRHYGNEITKLGKIEDLLDEYNVKDLEELDKLLTMATSYEELSKQIGCPLEVLYNAQINGFFDKKEGKINFYNPVKDFIVIDFRLGKLQVALSMNFCNVITFYLKDYKKTWWLKEDKSE